MDLKFTGTPPLKCGYAREVCYTAFLPVLFLGLMLTLFQQFPEITARGYMECRVLF